MAKKAAAAAEKAAQEEEKREHEVETAWQQGARDTSRETAAAAERDRKLRLKAENAAILAAEEGAVAGGGKKKSGKKKGKDDFDLLNAALAAQPKTKAQKELEAKKLADEERKKKEAEASALKAQRLKEQEDYIKEQARKGIIVDHAEELLLHTRDINTLDEDEDVIVATGIEDAIEALTVTDGMVDTHPERRRKALYNAYFDAMLPRMKEDYPGLRLQQYKERIFEMWQSAPENPMNATPTSK